jgi:hypothetical protein
MAAPTARNWEVSNVSNALKEYYSRSGIKDACYSQSTLCLLNPGKFNIKKTPVSGSQFVSPIQYAASGGLGMTVAEANASAKESAILRWVVTPKKVYKKDNISTDLLYSATGDPAGAFWKASINIIDKARVDLVVELERRLFGAGTGQIGTVSSSAANVITLTNAADARNFEVGMSVTGTVVGTNITQVTAVNRSAGTVTVSSDTDIDTLNDPIYRYGFATIDTAGIQGLQKQFPTTRTSANTVHTIDQSLDWNRLAGTHVDATGASPYEAVTEGVMQAKAEGGDPTHLIMSFEDLAALMNDGQGQKMYSVGDPLQIGTKIIEIAVPDGGLVKVLGSAFCPASTIYALNQPDLELVHWGSELMNIQNNDGSILHYSDTDDVWNVRQLAMFDLIVNTPAKHAVITL